MCHIFSSVFVAVIDFVVVKVSQVLKMMFNAVKHLKLIPTFKWIKCRNMRSSEGCVFVTEAEMLGFLPLTKLYSGIQCYIQTSKAKENECEIHVDVLTDRCGYFVYNKALNIQFNVHILCNQFCAALAMQYWCWKCLDNSLCLKMYLQVSF